MTQAEQLTHISTIKVGDTVHHDGHWRTVGTRDLKPSTFMGTTLWGDSYRAGTVLIRKASHAAYPTHKT